MFELQADEIKEKTSTSITLAKFFIYFLNNPFGNPERKSAVEKHREFRPHF
jgi:hypothetical protein